MYDSRMEPEVYGEVKLGCMTAEWNNQLTVNLLEEGFLACLCYFKNILSEGFMKMMKLKYIVKKGRTTILTNISS